MTFNDVWTTVFNPYSLCSSLSCANENTCTIEHLVYTTNNKHYTGIHVTGINGHLVLTYLDVSARKIVAVNLVFQIECFCDMVILQPAARTEHTSEVTYRGPRTAARAVIYINIFIVFMNIFIVLWTYLWFLWTKKGFSKICNIFHIVCI